MRPRATARASLLVLILLTCFTIMAKQAWSATTKKPAPEPSPSPVARTVQPLKNRTECYNRVFDIYVAARLTAKDVDKQRREELLTWRKTLVKECKATFPN